MSLICWSQCKKFALHMAQGRAHKFTRVGLDVQPHLESIMRREIGRLVHACPSKGKTIQMETHKRKDSNEPDTTN